MNYSVSEENYIKTIFHLQKKEGTVTTNELAGELKNPSGIGYGYDEKTES